jgi:hypothetical protein
MSGMNLGTTAAGSKEGAVQRVIAALQACQFSNNARVELVQAGGLKLPSPSHFSLDVEALDWQEQLRVRRYGAALAYANAKLCAAESAAQWHRAIALADSFLRDLYTSKPSAEEIKTFRLVAALQAISRWGARAQVLKQGKVNCQAYNIPQGYWGVSAQEQIGSRNIFNCLSAALWDPRQKAVIVTHIDDAVNMESLGVIVRGCGLQLEQFRLLGERLTHAPRKNKAGAVAGIFQALGLKLVSRHVGRMAASTAWVINPADFSVSYDVPGRDSSWQCIAPALAWGSPYGKVLGCALDTRKSKDFFPVLVRPHVHRSIYEKFYAKSFWESALKHFEFASQKGAPLFENSVVFRYFRMHRAVLTPLQHLVNQRLEQLSSQAVFDRATAAKQALAVLSCMPLYFGRGAEARNSAVVDMLQDGFFSVQGSGLNIDFERALDIFKASEFAPN